MVLTNARVPAVSECEVRMLVSLADKLTQAPRTKSVLCDDPAPEIRILLQVGCHACWHVRPRFDIKDSGHGWPHVPPLEHVAVGDIERLVHPSHAGLPHRHKLPPTYTVGFPRLV
jgi:hypothetical protein